MWGHYADRHKGMCLGFDVPDESTMAARYIDCIREEGKITPTVELVTFLLTAKFADWSYEREVRLPGARQEIDEEISHYFTDFNDSLKLKEVIAGARFPLSEASIEEALLGHSEEVRIIKGRRSESEFKIVVGESGFGRR